jgi:alpha-glucosidase (family GH31 glycosyl hydrolase)
MLDHLNSKMKVSGIWLDANEVVDIIMFFEKTRPIHLQNVEKRKYYTLPFYPGITNLYKLDIVNVDSIHYGGIEEFNVRSLTAFYQSQFTYNHLLKQDQIYFPFVLSRGNKFGNGQFSFHFIPDLGSSWASLRNALAPVMNYNLYGIPVVGADICGMGSDFKSPPELCARWYQMGVFYIFARNHHTPTREVDNSQEPYRYTGIYFDAIKAAIQLRYSLLKQIYTYFFIQPRQSDNKKLRVGTILRPLFFEFHDHTLPPFGTKYFEDQFMVSDSIMGAPVLDEGRIRLDVYFPQSRWFDMRHNKELAAVQGAIIEIQAPLTEGTPYFLRGGKILMKQKVNAIRRSDDLDNNFTLIAGLDFPVQGQSSAHGSILDVADYSEENIYNECVLKDCLMKISLVLTEGADISITLKAETPLTSPPKTPVTVTNLVLLGVSNHNDLKPQGHFTLSGDFIKKGCAYTFDASKNLLNISIPDSLTLVTRSEYQLSL